MDLGAGGGLPGLILALAWPETTWCLVEASARRAGHLEAMVRRSSLGDRVLVLHERAELVAHEPEWREQAPLITARSFGPPAATAECAAGLVRIGGRLVVSEPPTPGDTPRWPSAPLRELGFTAEVAHARGFGFAVLTKRWPCPTSIPRRPGVPQRRLRF